MLKRSQVIKRLQENRAELESLGVKSLSLFGSVARDTARGDSDVDLLVEFTHPVGLFQFIDLQNFLEKILNCPVDLGTPKSLHPRVKENVLQEAIHVV